MTLPPPEAFGLPPWFPEWREDQVPAFTLMLEAKTRFIALTMPVGCLTGDTEVFTNRAGNGHRTTLAKLHYTETFHASRRKPGVVPYTRSFTGSRIGLHVFEGVVYHGERPTWRLRLKDGRELRGTATHQILTPSGFKEIANLSPGEIVICDTPRPKPSTGKKHKRPPYARVQGLLYHPYANHVVSNVKKGNYTEGRLYIVVKHRLIIEAAMNGLSLEDFIAICRTSPAIAETLAFLDPEIWAVHHKNKNSLDNWPENLEVLTHAAHLALHGDANHFGQGAPNYVAVETVTPTDTQEDVYDLLAVAPYENFVANGIVVHNSGKTLACMAAAAVTRPGRTVVVTATKGLQDQYGKDYEPMGLVDVRGQANYPCRALEKDGEWSLLRDGTHTGCDHGPCHVGLPCTLHEAGCSYYDRLRLAGKSDLVVTNYDLWFAQQRWGKGLGTVDLLVLDEAHQAPEALSNALQIKLERWLCNALGLYPPGPASEFTVWVQWAAYQADKLKGILDVKAVGTSSSDLKYRRRVKQAEQVLRSMAGMQVAEWVADHTSDAWVFELVRPARYAEALLFQQAKRVVLISATLTDKTLSQLGISPEIVTQWECPSRFAVARRQVWYIPTVKVDYRMNLVALNAWANRIDQILDLWPDVRIIVHTVSYKRAADYANRSRHLQRLLVHEKQPVGQIVQQFKTSPMGTVLVSPAVGTGFDFPYDQCRVQVVAKLPFPSTQSQIVQARQQLDPDYAAYQMCQALEQTVGRGCRAEDDWCVTLIIDDQWAWVQGKYKAFFTSSFKQAVKRSATIPPRPAFAV